MAPRLRRIRRRHRRRHPPRRRLPHFLPQDVPPEGVRLAAGPVPGVTVAGGKGLRGGFAIGGGDGGGEREGGLRRVFGEVYGELPRQGVAGGGEWVQFGVEFGSDGGNSDSIIVGRDLFERRNGEDGGSVWDTEEGAGNVGEY